MRCIDKKRGYTRAELNWRLWKVKSRRTDPDGLLKATDEGPDEVYPWGYTEICFGAAVQLDASFIFFICGVRNVYDFCGFRTLVVFVVFVLVF